jgi:hypothetical protein
MKFHALLFTLILFSACGGPDADRVSTSTRLAPPPSEMKINYLSPASLDVREFISTLRYAKPADTIMDYVSISDSFPEGWVKAEDLEFLMGLIRSQERSRCLMNYTMEYTPPDHASLGGHAIELINSYRRGERLRVPLFSCPKYNTQKIEETEQWWNTNKEALPKTKVAATPRPKRYPMESWNYYVLPDTIKGVVVTFVDATRAAAATKSRVLSNVIIKPDKGSIFRVLEMSENFPPINEGDKIIIIPAPKPAFSYSIATFNLDGKEPNPYDVKVLQTTFGIIQKRK